MALDALGRVPGLVDELSTAYGIRRSVLEMGATLVLLCLFQRTYIMGPSRSISLDWISGTEKLVLSIS